MGMGMRVGLVLTLCVACAHRGEPLTVPSLETSQPLVSELIAWRNGLVAFAGHEGGVFFATPDEERFEPLSVAGCERILALAGSGALCANDGKLAVVEEGSETLEVPLRAGEYGARMARDGETTAVATGTAIAVHSPAAGWRAIELHFGPEYRVAFFPPAHLRLAQRLLWLGYDGGEFGGGLYRMAIPPAGPLPTPEVVYGQNVLGIEKTPGGELWIGSGIHHLGVRRAALLRVVDGDVHTIELDWRRRDGGSRDRAFAAFTLSPEGAPLVVDAEAGVYEVRDGTPSLLFARVLGVRHETTWIESGEQVPVTGQYGPTDVVAWPDGRLFVAYDGLGVVELSGPHGTPGTVRQLRLR